ncbi:MAG: M28 family peptidase, partial [Bacteroidia bacterium]|nr:M28 family peptidase [Bacteroidia bacterium]
IPTIDIIHYDAASRTGFPGHWHTHNDNMNAIDRNTLKAVGQTLLEVIYTQK